MLATGDELVDHHLRAVGKIAELGFPDHQRARRGGRVAVFERQDGLFRKEGVVQVETRLVLDQMLQRDIGPGVLLVVQYRVTVREGATADVLAGHANRVAFEQQGRVRHGFGEAPVDRQPTGSHFLAIFEDLRNLTLNDEPFRYFEQLVRQFLQRLEVEAGVVTRGPGVAQIRTPVDEQFLVRLLDQAFHHVQAVVQGGTVLVDLRLDALGIKHASLGQSLGVQLARSALLGDLLIHQGLGATRLVGLVVATTAVADQIDDHVTLELHAIIDRQLGDEQHRFRIVAIHVQDRRLHHLRHVGRVLGGTRVLLTADGEANLVVDHDANRATSSEAAGLRHLEGFHDHALPRNSGITVDGYRKHLVTGKIVATILTGTHRTLDHWRDDFQVRRVERQCEMNLTAGGHHVGRKALVILDVAGAQALDLLALELVEQVARVLAEGIHQHVKAATVGHTDDDFLVAVRTRALNDFIQQRNQALATFQAKTLGTRILGTQVFFQAFSGGEALEQMATHFGGKRRAAAHALQTLLEPLALLGIDNVGELGADGAAVGLLQGFLDFTQGCFFLADVELTGTEGGIQIGIGQAVMIDRQIGRSRALSQTQRVKLGSLVATHAVGLDQTQDFNLLLLMLAAYAPGRYRLSATLILGEQNEVIADRRVRDIGGSAAIGRQLLEIGAPLFWHSVGIVQVELVELFHIGSVTTGKVGTVPHALHYAFLHAWSPSVRGHHQRGHRSRPVWTTAQTDPNGPHR